MPDETEQPETVGFLIDERPVFFLRDRAANLRFLQGIDSTYWLYQATAHQHALESSDVAERHHAAAALRIAFGQGVETLLALLVSVAQVPEFMLGWMLAYRNDELRSAVAKIQDRRGLLSKYLPAVSWRSLSEVIHSHIQEPDLSNMVEPFANVWRRLASEFLSDAFEPEYNNLKHGMRARVGGFGIMFGLNQPDGSPPPPDEMSTMTADYGSTFWRPAIKIPGSKRSYQLGAETSRSWSPKLLVHGLRLIAMSVHNVSAIAAARELPKWPGRVPYMCPPDVGYFDIPWSDRPSLGVASLGAQLWSMLDVSTAEPTEDEIRGEYRHKSSQ